MYKGGFTSVVYVYACLCVSKLNYIAWVLYFVYEKCENKTVMYPNFFFDINRDNLWQSASIAVASISILGGRSLHPAKNRGEFCYK